MTSNAEHDDCEVRMFTCFCGKGWEGVGKNVSQVRCSEM